MPYRSVSLRFRAGVLAFAWAGMLAGCGSDSAPAPPKAGVFDTSFGSNGIAAPAGPPFEGASSSASFASADPATGIIRAAGEIARNSVHAHLLPIGGFDTGFAGTGWMLTPPEPTSSFFADLRKGLALFPRSDGTEVLVESKQWPCLLPAACAIAGGPPIEAVARLVGPAGAPAPGYGNERGEGVLMIEPLQAVAEPSGAVLVVGSVSAGPFGMRRKALRRLTPQGSPDDGFATRADASIHCPGFDPLRATAAVMARRPDGKLLLSQSYVVLGTPNAYRVCLSRLQPDGTIDAVFGTGGYVTLGAEFQWENIAPVAIFPLPNGGSALFLQTRASSGGSTLYHYMIATMTAEGALDASRFDRGVTGPTNLHVAKLEAVARQADGKFLVAGFPVPGDGQPGTGLPVPGFDPSQPRIGRLHPEGGADLSFGSLGTGYTPLLSFGKRLVPRHVSIGPDRGIFIAGSLGDAGPVNDNELTKFGVAKLTGDAAAAP